MNIWGKILGSTGGFALGGPLGALLGVIAGHAIDKIKNKKLPEQMVVKQVGFTIGVIALSAKMAKADGKVTREDHGDVANAMIRLYAESKKARERQSMGFKLSKWDEKLLQYSHLFEEQEGRGLVPVCQ